MIRTSYFPQHYKVSPWKSALDEDEEAKLWIYSQLMGETEKGDTLEFVHAKGSGVELYAGVLKDRAGVQKALIPATFCWKHDGVFTEVEYAGTTNDTDDTIKAQWREGEPCDIDQVVQEKFLENNE